MSTNWTRPCDHARQALALPQGMVTYGHCIQGIVMAALRSFAGMIHYSYIFFIIN